MPEKERELYWRTLNDNIKRCQSFADRYKSKDPTLAYLAYDCELFSKSLLLCSSQAVRQSILGSNNGQLIAKWNKLAALKNNPQSNADTIRVLEKQLLIDSKEYQQQQTSFSTTWKDVVLSLTDDEAVIEFITYETPDSTGIEERIYTALILRRNGSQTEIAMLTQCEENSLRQAIDSSDYNFEKLYPLVWNPMDEYLVGVKKVYISPTGLLNSIPFTAINNKGRYISDKYIIHTVLSSKDVISLKNNSNQPFNKEALLFGGADFGLPTAELDKSDNILNDKVLRSLLTELQEERGQGFDYLPGSKQEVEKINEILSKQNWEVTAFVDRYATETRLKSSSGQNSPALLHISTHGYYFPIVKEPTFNNGMSESTKFYKQSDNPLIRCGLLFSGANSTWNGQEQAENTDDGILTAYEISNLNLSNTDLVVLSACETGLGDVDYSEGVYGLQRAFRLAGAKSMIVSLWKVSDKDALEFMIEFYRQWALSKNKKEAFDKAQGKMRKKYDEVKKWAGFILIE
jgi:CHAT domain-containing protein